MSKLYSDGQGTFLYVDKCNDDENFVNLRIEEEQEDNSYTKSNISLYKGDIQELAIELETLANAGLHTTEKVSEYIVTVSYWPFVVGKNKVSKVQSKLSKEEVYSRILNKEESKSGYFEVSISVETVEEYLKDIPNLEL